MDLNRMKIVDTDNNEIDIRDGVVGFFRSRLASQEEIYNGQSFGFNNFGPPSPPGRSLAVGKGEAGPYWPYGPNGSPSHAAYEPGYYPSGDSRNRNSLIHGFYTVLQPTAYGSIAVGEGNNVGTPSFVTPASRIGQFVAMFGDSNVTDSRFNLLQGFANRMYSGDSAGASRNFMQGARNTMVAGPSRYNMMQGSYNDSYYCGRMGLIQGIDNFFDFAGIGKGEYTYNDIPVWGLFQGFRNRVIGSYGNPVNNNTLLGFANVTFADRGFAQGRYVQVLNPDQKSWGTNRLGLTLLDSPAFNPESKGGAQWNECPRWLETADDTPTNITSLKLEGDKAVGVKAWVVAKNTDTDAEVATFYLDAPALANRDGGVITHGAVTNGPFQVGELVFGWSSYNSRSHRREQHQGDVRRRCTSIPERRDHQL